jgi:hypothetical protein
MALLAINGECLGDEVKGDDAFQKQTVSRLFQVKLYIYKWATTRYLRGAWLAQYSDPIRAGRYGDRIPACADRDFPHRSKRNLRCTQPPVQRAPGVFRGGQGVVLANHPHLTPR